MLSAKGLPTPNIFAGGHEFHSVREWASRAGHGGRRGGRGPPRTALDGVVGDATPSDRGDRLGSAAMFAHMTLHGTVAAVVTPLRDGGTRLDDGGGRRPRGVRRGRRMRRRPRRGHDGRGAPAHARTERRALAEAWLDAVPGGIQVAVHAGAQTTAEAVALAEHAARAGAAAVAVIGPPYFAFDAAEIEAHFAAVIAACAPTPAYLYEFRDRTGYVVPPAVVERLRDAHPSLSGMKVSDRSFEEVEPYLRLGLDVFVGSEPLIPRAMAAGATGAVSGLATALSRARRRRRRRPHAGGRRGARRGAQGTRRRAQHAWSQARPAAPRRRDLRRRPGAAPRPHGERGARDRRGRGRAH